MTIPFLSLFLKLLLFIFLLFHLPCVISSDTTNNNNNNHFSVPESVPIGHIIGYISGKAEQSATPRYFVVFPDEQTSKFLKVDEKSGEISTVAHLDYEKRAKFEIVAVKVDDHGETIDVVIEVDDENDNTPEWTEESIKLNISEFAQLGTSFGLPIVTDGDGPRYDVHKFAILQGNVNNVFKISSRKVNEQLQADLVVNGQLDREFRDKYELIVEAQDGGKPPKTGQLRVSIQIIDANDNAPTFSRSRYSATISANTSIGSNIITVSAVDSDIGENAIISYDIKKTTSPSNQNFAISQSGVISTTAHLLPASTHDVIVVATDHGTPPLSSSAVVTITVLGSSLSAPPLDVIWLVESNSAHLLENSTIGSIVARVSISEEYRDSKLKLMGCSALCPQQTDISHVYLLLLCGILDRESTPEYNIKFLLEKNGQIVVEHPQLLTIGDVNDNWPQWHSSQVHISLNRTQGGSRTLTAKDPDLGQNGWIRYTIMDTELVSIDKETGRIFVPTNIDCNIGPEIKFRIRAEDGGNPPLFSDLQVIADLIDAQSKPPQFEKALWQVEIVEDTPVGTCLVKVVANNTQCGSSKRIRYNMQEKDEYLSIDSISGTVCILKQFDYEQSSSYQATVVATNSNAETTTCLISVRLKDVNDNWPIFYPNDYQLTVREGPIPSEPLLVVSASDVDTGIFGEVTYQILSDSNSFSINSITGEIFAKMELKRGRYHLIVSGKDGAMQTAENPANVHITVIDNDTKVPEFSRSKYEIQTTEDILPGIAIGSVAALSEGRIKYSIYSGDPDHNFSIDEETGKIYVTRYLDADVHDTVLLNIQATIDGGNSNQTQVLINIEDHNDNYPTFPSQVVEITVREDNAINEPFYVIHASDKDKKRNGEVRYSIVSSHPASSIQIDSNSGQLSATSSFDYESVRDYKVRIKAFDGGIPSKSSNMTLFIHVSDVNDNFPKFERSSYVMEVVENAPSKIIIGKVMATDIDSGENEHIMYRVTNGSEYFGIDEKLGTIYSKRSLDREVISHVDISVIAEDKGVPSKSSSISVRVNVLDVNDNPPSCHSITPIVVPANAPPSTAIGTIVATDPDRGLNGSVLYRAQLQSSLFVVKANGDVYLRRQLNASEEHHQRLSVIVSDQGIPRKSVVCHVAVRVSKGSSDIVLQEPVLRFISIPEGCNTTCRIIRFNATGVHSWQIQSSEISNHFLLRDGVLSMTSRPSHRPPYSLVIVLSDSQGRQKSIQIRVIATGEVLNREETIRIMDTTGIGSKIGKLGEKSNDGTFFYRFSKSINETSELDCPLDLDQTVGTLYLADGIRSSARDKNYSCYFEKFNTTSGNIDDMRVDLEINRSKNEKPYFESQKVVIKVKEDTTPGTIITTVNASSNDESLAPISYRFSTLIDSFAIDQFTGDITLIDSLHWHKKATHHLVVEAFTSGRYSTTLVVVEVEDVNDQIPKIISPPILILPSTIRRGNVVHRIVSVDNDKDPNTKYELKVESSNFRINSSSGEISIITSSLRNIEESIVVRSIDSDSETKYDEQIIGIKHSNSSHKHWHYFEEQKRSISLNKVGKHSTITSYPVNGKTAKLRLIPNSPYFEMQGYDVIQTTENLPTSFQKQTFTVFAELNDNYDWSILEISASLDQSESLKIASTSCGMVSIEEKNAYKNFKRIMAVGTTKDATFRFQGKSDKFSIDQTTGEISSFPLDRESLQEHLLVVILTDGNNNDSCTVRVTVVDVNDNSPIFDSSTPSEIQINETSNVGDVIVRLSASDMDIGLNGKISFELLEDESKALDVVPETGAMVLRRLPKIQAWQIKVRVFDHGTPSLSAEKTIQLTVRKRLETPSEQPKPIAFLRQSYVSSIDESLPRGQYIGKLETSEDVGVTYSIVEGNIDSAFSIDSDGIVRSNLELDKEIIERYNLKIIGIGKESGQISTRMDVRINNINDNIPSFPAMKPKRISEGLKPGSYITTISAKDVDQLSPLQYFLLNKQDIFNIDRFTGVIHLVSSLDYETEKEHTLKLRVSDGQFETSSNLTIMVSDVNDNAPRFSKNFYNTQVSPSTYSPDIPFAQIEATDSDSGQNSKIIYSVDNESDGGIFRISPDDGSLYLKVLPPTGEKYVITVTATDGGVPSLSSSIPVSILIGDLVQTERPSFEKHEYSFELLENSPGGVLIGSLIDNDSPREYFYRISDQEATNHFEVDRFGRIFTLKEIDREKKNRFEFDVEIDTDMTSSSTQHSGILNAKCRVVVIILDENDNSPTFINSIAHISLKDSMSHGQTIASLSANDADSEENGRVSYHILTGNDYNILTINHETGSIMFNEWNDSQLDEFPNATWQMQVEARDHGIPHRSSIATVVVSLKMSSWSGSAPFFVLPSYEVHVLEDTPMNTIIQQVKASNRLGIRTKGLLYSLKENKGKFVIDVKSGDIRLKTHLDWESEQQYSMFLSVSDGNGRSAVVPLKIIVEPVDEFAPVFTKSMYTLQVSTSSSIGDVIGQMQAIDEDGGAHGIVKYAITDRQNTVDIEQNSGIIRLRKDLSSRQNLTIEQINVIAYSSPNKQSKTTVYLEIGPFSPETILPRLLHSRSVQIAAASLLLLLTILIVLICVCICRSKQDKKSEDPKPIVVRPQKQVYSVKTGEIRTLSGDLALSNNSTANRRHPVNDKTNSMSSSMSTSSDALRMIRGSSRSQMDSGIDPDNISINSSVTDYLVSIGVNPNPIPPRIRQNTTYDSLMNEYIYARVEDVLPPGPISLSNPHQHSLLRQPMAGQSHRKPPIVPSFEPLTEIFNEILEMRKAEEDEKMRNQKNIRKDYVQVEI